jgi:hypothetical protein
MEALFISTQIPTGREIEEKKSVIAELTNVEKALCGMLKERSLNSSRKVQGFTFYASVKGSQMTYPAGEAAAGAGGGICIVCLLYWYKSTNSDANAPASLLDFAPPIQYYRKTSSFAGSPLQPNPLNLISLI